MAPSPIDGGCVFSGIGEVENPDIICPAGTEPGPSDDCVPIIKELTKDAMTDNIMTTLTKRGMLRHDMPELPVDEVPHLSGELLQTYDIGGVLYSTAERLDAEMIEP
jgi:hypothetical protein